VKVAKDLLHIEALGGLSSQSCLSVLEEDLMVVALYLELLCTALLI